MASYSSDQQVANATADAQMVPLGQRARITGIQAEGAGSSSIIFKSGGAAGTAANVIKFGSSGTITDADTWVDIGSSDLPIFIDFSAGTSGVGNITVEYIQNINNA